MNILIVDDEPRHRRGMMNLILSLRPHHRLHAAGDGEAALKHVRADRTDLVLTDIRMPNMDGLQFLKRLEDERPKPRVVMVSAYNLFDYAQEALRHGASDYLLKPVDVDKLEAVLERIEAELALEERRRREADELRHRLSRTQSAYRSRLFADWLGGSLTADEARELERAERLNEGGLVVCTQIEIAPERLNDRESELFVRQLESGWSALGSATSFALESVRESFVQAVTIIRGPFPTDPDGRLAFRRCADTRLAGLNEWGTVRHGIGPACAELLAGGAESFRLAREAASQGDRGRADGPVFFHEELPVPTAATIGTGTNAGGDADAPAAACLQWIEDHLHEELTLERAAERFFFNSSYFSTWIKQQTGSTFTRHLTEARMRRARLLLDTGRRIRETAEACGYPDTKYFCRVFKKAHGVSPAAYKHGAMRRMAGE